MLVCKCISVLVRECVVLLVCGFVSVCVMCYAVSVLCC